MPKDLSYLRKSLAPKPEREMLEEEAPPFEDDQLSQLDLLLDKVQAQEEISEEEMTLLTRLMELLQKMQVVMNPPEEDERAVQE